MWQFTYLIYVYILYIYLACTFLQFYYNLILISLIGKGKLLCWRIFQQIQSFYIIIQTDFFFLLKWFSIEPSALFYRVSLSCCFLVSRYQASILAFSLMLGVSYWMCTIPCSHPEGNARVYLVGQPPCSAWFLTGT